MISTLKEISKKVKEQKKHGKKVGLITGCFDVLHFEHIQLFRFAKKHVDFLVVGLDNDKTISLNKGKNRPVNSINHRLQVISELRSVDAVFEITGAVDFRDNAQADLVHQKVLDALKPDYLITNIKADDYWKEKKERVKHLHTKFLPLKLDRHTSSTAIIDKLTK